MRRFALAALTAATVLLAVPATAGAPKVARYQLRSGDAPTRLVVRGSCLAAEDSAAHLVLISYDGDKAVYSCDSSSY